MKPEPSARVTYPVVIHGHVLTAFAVDAALSGPGDRPPFIPAALVALGCAVAVGVLWWLTWPRLHWLARASVGLLVPFAVYALGVGAWALVVRLG
ncbi:MAG: hypothetical protein AAF628_12445 [Planctomycetota bacterium]